MLFKTLFAAALAGVSAQDPASSWLSYAVYKDPQDRIINYINATWTVPQLPANGDGSNAPGWWFGVQTKDGNGALVQPILAYGYTGNNFCIFNGVYDWTDQSWHTSDPVNVNPGDKITSWVSYNSGDNSYDLFIASNGQSSKMNYPIEQAQTENDSVAYFVLEHQPDTCASYPPDGVCTFTDINLQVAGKPVKPTWTAAQENPACNSLATVVDSRTLKFTWNAKSTNVTAPTTIPGFARPRVPPKWQPWNSKSPKTLRQ